MRVAVTHLKGVTPYSQSKAFGVQKDRNETDEEFDGRMWKEHCHVDGKGMVFIPPMAFKNCLDEAAKYKSIKISGKGKATYTKHFEAGVLCTSPVPLGVHIDDVVGERLFLNSNGTRGGNNRVWRTYPVFRDWEADVTFHIFDETVTRKVFETHLVDAGQFIGIGRFRPRNHGFYGKFAVESASWTQL